MLNQTVLYDKHIKAGAKMVEFAGFSLPINYGSQIQEHQAVREQAGMFDVSHMVISDISGTASKDFLSQLLANDIGKLKTEGKALYSCMLTDKGGIIDDLIVYWIQDDYYRIISNGATRDKDLAWMQKVISDFDANLTERPELSVLAVQGPAARDKVISILPEAIQEKVQNLKRFFGTKAESIFIGRTGYTGEDGFEILADKDNIQQIWDQLLQAGVKPCGLGARDSLRMEAGMMLYGTDMNEDDNPLESGLKWTVSLERNFIGKQALMSLLEAGIQRKMVGLTLKGKGIMRPGQEVFVDEIKVGLITSGGFSPVLNQSIAFARVDKSVGTSCLVKIRDKFLDANVGGLNFVKHT